MDDACNLQSIHPSNQSIKQAEEREREAPQAAWLRTHIYIELAACIESGGPTQARAHAFHVNS
jgi:hypothetical protein